MKLTEMDSLLLPYLEAADEADAQQLIAALMAEQAEPLIKGIVSRKLGGAFGWGQNEIEDVCSEIVLHLLQRLHVLHSDSTETPIANFRAYVVRASYHGCAAYLRQRYPQRRRLANRLYYLLTSQAQFGLWQNENEEWFGGFAGWANDLLTRRWLDSARLHQLLDVALPAPLRELPDATLRRVRAAEQLAAVLTWADEFIALDDLVTVFAHWWNVNDHVAPRNETVHNLADKRDESVNVEAQVEQRIYLQKLWMEIKELPVRQRQALLLNLRSGRTRSVLALFPALQIASLRQIATALEMPAGELAELWNQLPLDDVRIAAQLNVTRRQIINLRLAARERLLRKMRGW